MSLLKCPSCNSTMEKVKEPDITVDRCSKCGSTFLDKGELNVLATGMAGNIEYCSVDDEENPDTYPSRKCPKCTEQRMKKMALLCYTDIILDFCPKCEGFYLDKGEIKEMNIELSKLAPKKVAEEYRGHIEGHLVCLDKLNEIRMSAGVGGMGSVPRDVCFLKITVYLNNPLNLGLRIYSEKWTDKFTKAIGLFSRQDIQVGDTKLDSSFIIQGNKSSEIISLLSRKNIIEGLLHLASKKPKMFTNSGKLEILDNCIVLTEGPYGSKTVYDIESDPESVVSSLLNLAKLFDNRN